MEPMDGPKSWPRSDYATVLPPTFRAMPGRPKKNRVQVIEEKEDKARKKRRRMYERDELLTRDTRDSSKLGRVGRVMSCKSCKGKDIISVVRTGPDIEPVQREVQGLEVRPGSDRKNRNKEPVTIIYQNYKYFVIHI
ncbi:hypothetical protein LINPERHAP1_LOCUS8317 [Linum perenne]